MNYPESELVPNDWNAGDVILNKYEVLAKYTSGGMGVVYKVHHREWDMEMAVKSPRSEYFKTKIDIENFEREATTWVNIGLHPNIVGCYYIRRLGGIPKIFSEFVEVGSLSDCIKNRSLYSNDNITTLERIIDISIQMAWGLQIAHSKGIVHQDVKPANVLIDADGTAKISDFGIARALAASSANHDTTNNTKLSYVTSGGLTPAYCSPEQAAGNPVSIQTDIWSWAVSVLEMLNREITWADGRVAPQVLESMAAESLIPSGLFKVLKSALNPNLKHRYQCFEEISKELIVFYEGYFRKPYSRLFADKAKFNSWQEHNRGISLFDLTESNYTADESFLIELAPFNALREKYPELIESHFMIALMCWRNRRCTLKNAVYYLKGIETQKKYRKNLISQLQIEAGVIFSSEDDFDCVDSIQASTSKIIKDVTYLGKIIDYQTQGCKHDESMPFETLAILADGNTICLINYNSRVLLFNRLFPNELKVLNSRFERIANIKPHPHLNILAVWEKGGNIEIWDCDNLSLIRYYQSQNGVIKNVCFDGLSSIFINTGSAIRVLNFVTGIEDGSLLISQDSTSLLSIAYNDVTKSLFGLCCYGIIHEWKQCKFYVECVKLPELNEQHIFENVEISVVLSDNSWCRIVISSRFKLLVYDLEEKTITFKDLNRGLYDNIVLQGGTRFAFAQNSDHLRLIDISDFCEHELNPDYLGRYIFQHNIDEVPDISFHTLGVNPSGSVAACIVEQSSFDVLRNQGNSRTSKEHNHIFLCVCETKNSNVFDFEKAPHPIIRPEKLKQYYREQQTIRFAIQAANSLLIKGDALASMESLHESIDIKHYIYDSEVSALIRTIGTGLHKTTVFSVHPKRQLTMDKTSSNIPGYAYFPEENKLWFSFDREPYECILCESDSPKMLDCCEIDANSLSSITNFARSSHGLIGYDPVKKILVSGNQRAFDKRRRTTFLYHCSIGVFHRAIVEGAYSIFHLMEQTPDSCFVDLFGKSVSLTPIPQFIFPSKNILSTESYFNSSIFAPQPGLFTLSTEGFLEFINSINYENSIFSFDEKIEVFCVSTFDFKIYFLDSLGHCTCVAMPDKNIIFKINIKEYFSDVGRPKTIRSSFDGRLLLVGFENCLFLFEVSSRNIVWSKHGHYVDAFISIDSCYIILKTDMQDGEYFKITCYEINWNYSDPDQNDKTQIFKIANIFLKQIDALSAPNPSFTSEDIGRFSNVVQIMGLGKLSAEDAERILTSSGSVDIFQGNSIPSSNYDPVHGQYYFPFYWKNEVRILNPELVIC